MMLLMMTIIIIIIIVIPCTYLEARHPHYRSPLPLSSHQLPLLPTSRPLTGWWDLSECLAEAPARSVLGEEKERADLR